MAERPQLRKAMDPLRRQAASSARQTEHAYPGDRLEAWTYPRLGLSAGQYRGDLFAADQQNATQAQVT